MRLPRRLLLQGQGCLPVLHGSPHGTDGRARKVTAPGEHGVVDLSPEEFLDRLADLVPPPRKHRHRYHGVFAPNHRLRPAVTALAIGSVGTRGNNATGGHATGGLL